MHPDDSDASRSEERASGKPQGGDSDEPSPTPDSPGQEGSQSAAGEDERIEGVLQRQDAHDLLGPFVAGPAFVRSQDTHASEHTAAEGEDPYVGKAIGAYRLRRKIGGGAMGFVYEAEQGSLQRPVAVKLLAGTVALTRNGPERFRREAMIGSTLSHPNIVMVHDAGADHGQHYLVMQLVSGGNVSDLVKRLRVTWETALRETEHQSRVSTLATSAPSAQGRPPAADSAVAGRPPGPPSGSTMSYVPVPDSTPGSERLRQWLSSRGDKKSARAYFNDLAAIALGAAKGLAYAHNNGIVHRDVKASNLLLDREGRCLVADFGLARLEGALDLTQSGQVIGTFDYLSPEQAGGKLRAVDARSDIYSLGVTMYELFTLKRPYPIDLNTLQDLHHGRLRVAPPRRVEKDLPKELDLIVGKATQFAPEDRYQSADELAEDLQRYLRGEKPVHAKPLGVLEQGRRQLRKHLLAAAALMLALVVVAGATAAWARHRENFAKAQADLVRRQLQRVNSELLAARSALQLPADPYRALQLATEALQVEAIPESRQAWMAASDINWQTAEWDAAFSMRASVLAPNGDNVLLLGDSQSDVRAQLWRISPTPQLLATLPTETVVTSAIFSPQGDRILTLCTKRDAQAGTSSNLLQIWNAGNATEITRFPDVGMKYLHQDSIARDGRLVIHQAARLQIVDPALPGAPLDFDYPGGVQVLYAAFSPSGEQLAALGEDGSVALWRIRNRQAPGEERWVQPANARWKSESLSFSRDERWLAVVSANRVDVYDLDGKIAKTEQTWEGDFALFTNDSHNVLVFDRFTRHVDKYHLASGRRVERQMLPFNFAFIPSMRVPIDQQHQRLLLFGDASSPVVVDLETGGVLAKFDSSRRALRGALSADGGRAVVITADNWVQVWRTKSGRQLATFEGRPATGNYIHAWVNDELFAAPLAAAPETHLLDASDGRSLARIEGQAAGDLDLDGSHEILATYDEDSILFSRRQSGDRLARLNVAPANVRILKFDPTANLVVYVDRRERMWIWRPTDDGGPIPLTLPAAPVADLAVAVGGQQFAVARKDGTLQLWNDRLELTGSWQLPDALTQVAFLPSGDQLLVGLNNGEGLIQPLAPERAAIRLRVEGTRFDQILASHDGQVVLAKTADSQDLGGGAPSIVCLDAATGELRRKLPFGFSFANMRVAADRNELLVFSPLNGGLIWWDFDHDEHRPLTERPIADACFLSGGRVLSADYRPPYDSTFSAGTSWATTIGQKAPMLRTWNTLDGEELAAVALQIGQVTQLNTWGEQVLATTSAYRVGLFSTFTTLPRLRLEGCSAPLVALAASPDGKLLAGASLDHTASVWNVESGHRVATLIGHDAPLTAVDFDNQGARLLTAGGKQIRIWTRGDWVNSSVFTGHQDVVLQARFADDQVVSHSRDGVLRWWKSATEFTEKSSRRGRIRYLDINATGAVLACPADPLEFIVGGSVLQSRPLPRRDGRTDNYAEFYSAGGTTRIEFAMKSGPTHAALNPAGDRALIVDGDEVGLWRIQGNNASKAGALDVEAANGVGWTGDGKYFMIQHGDSLRVSIYDAETKKAVVELTDALLFDNAAVAATMSFNSPDGRVLLGDDARTARLRSWVLGSPVIGSVH